FAPCRIAGNCDAANVTPAILALTNLPTHVAEWRTQCARPTIAAGSGGRAALSRESSSSRPTRRPPRGRRLAPQSLEPVPGDPGVVRRVLWIAVSEVILHDRSAPLSARE